MTRPPRRPRRTTVFGVLRPFAIVAAAVVGSLLLFCLAAYVLPPSPQLRPAVHRLIVLNQSGETLSNVALTLRDQQPGDVPVMLGAKDDLSDGERWIVEHGLGENVLVELAFDTGDRRYEFHRAAALRADLGDLHFITITPGPRLHRREADVVRDR